MEYQIAEHKVGRRAALHVATLPLLTFLLQKKGLMPDDPRGNCNATVTPGTSELDSFKFRVLQGALRTRRALPPHTSPRARRHSPKG